MIRSRMGHEFASLPHCSALREETIKAEVFRDLGKYFAQVWRAMFFEKQLG